MASRSGDWEGSWARLHRWIYAIAIAAVMHYVWMRKGEAKPYLYVLFFAFLLGWRVRAWSLKNRQHAT